jgi:hypothetical protein
MTDGTYTPVDPRQRQRQARAPAAARADVSPVQIVSTPVRRETPSLTFTTLHTIHFEGVAQHLHLHIHTSPE